MPVVIPNVELTLMLDLLLANVAPAGTFDFRLYTNNLVPDGDTILADFVECILAGYAAQTATDADWGSNAPVTDGLESTLNFPLIFTTADIAGVNVYGYYLVSGTSGDLVWAERWAAPPIHFSSSEPVVFTPRFALLRQV